MIRDPSVAGYTLKQLELISVYGLASYILFILGFLGVYAYELHNAKQRAQHVSSIVNSVVKVFVIVVLFQLFVAFVFILVTAVAPIDETPAVGIHAFWATDWLAPNLMSTIPSSFTVEETQTAKTLLTMMTITTIAYLVTLVMLFFITLSFAMSLPLEVMQKDQSMNGLAIGIQGFLSFASASLVYVVLLSFSSKMLGWVIDFSNDTGKTTGLSNDIDLATDLGYIIKIGVDQWTTLIQPIVATPIFAN